MPNIKKTKTAEQPPADAAGDANDEQRERSPYHCAAVGVFSYLLRTYRRNGSVALIDEHMLSKEPLRIDIVIIKKIRDVWLKPLWARIFRGHNLIEYKSPADKPLTLAVFYKQIGYSNIYAAQENIKISDVTTTIVCAKTPRKLFKILMEEFDYEILEKYDGIYYIMQKGVAPEKQLGIQIMVQKSEALLQAMDKKPLDEDTVDKVAKTFVAAQKNGETQLGDWFSTLNDENIKHIFERMKRYMENKDSVLRVLKSMGYTEMAERKGRLEGIRTGRREGIQTGILKGRREGRREGIQTGILKGRREGRREGMQEGVQKVFALLEKGYSLPEAKKKLKLA